MIQTGMRLHGYYHVQILSWPLGAWLAQSEECMTLDLRVVSLGPTLSVENS